MTKQGQLSTLIEKAREPQWFVCGEKELQTVFLFGGWAVSADSIGIDVSRAVDGFESLRKEVTRSLTDDDTAYLLSLAGCNADAARRLLDILGRSATGRTGRNQYDFRQSSVFSIVAAEAELYALNALLLEGLYCLGQDLSWGASKDARRRAAAALTASHELLADISKLAVRLQLREPRARGCYATVLASCGGIGEINRQISSSNKRDNLAADVIVEGIGLH